MKITMYELLGLVKDGKAPYKIKYDNMIWEFDGDFYGSQDNYILEEYCNLTTSLNDEVEIIEEEKSINGWNNKIAKAASFSMNSKEDTIEDRYREMEKVRNYKPNPSYLPPKEEKKIPEKLDIRQEKNIKNNWKWKVYGEEHSYNISTPQKIIADKLNEVLDYLESKGE